MIRVNYTDSNGKQFQSDFKSQEEYDKHKLDYPDMYDGYYLISEKDVSIEVDLQNKINSDDESDKLCIKAYKLVKFHNRKFASKESLMGLMQNQQAMWLLLFLLGGSPDLALGLIQQMDKTMYPPELIAEVTELLILAIELTKEK